MALDRSRATNSLQDVQNQHLLEVEQNSRTSQTLPLAQAATSLSNFPIAYMTHDAYSILVRSLCKILELHISPHEYCRIIVLIFIKTTQPFNFYYNYERLQLVTSYLTIHLLMFYIQCIVRSLQLSHYYCLQL
jgi:hypothetical protein